MSKTVSGHLRAVNDDLADKAFVADLMLYDVLVVQSIDLGCCWL